MSILQGIVSLTGKPVNRKDIQAMTEVTRSFCPDGSEIWIEGGSALSCNLLNVLPKGRFEQMPVLHEEETGLVMVADARIDNREELLIELGFHEGKSFSDNKIILEAYKKWGDACTPKLIGDFAFAIWDKGKKRLFCCQDVFGVRPFHYCKTKDFFAFCSDEAGIIALDSVPVEIEEKYIADLLCGLHFYNNESRYKGVSTIPFANTLVLENGEIHLERYWEPDFSKEIRFEHEEEYVEKYLELLTEAVKCRLASNETACSLISGGLDSSSISAIGAGILRKEGKTLSTYCNVLPEGESNPEKDERELVLLLEKMTEGLSVTFVSEETFHPEALLNNTNHNEFILDGMPYINTILLKSRELGSRVLLDGYGGDEVATYNGNEVFDALLRQGQFSKFFRQAEELAKVRGRSRIRITLGLLKQFLTNRTEPPTDKLVKEFLYNRCAINHEFADRLGIMELARESHRFTITSGTIREKMWDSLISGKTPNKVFGNHFARHQVEKRYPMYDRRLVEFCLSIPEEQHRLGMGRRLIRRAMKGILPDEIRLRENKRISTCPNINKIVGKDIAIFRKALEEASSVPEVQKYIDLKKIGDRLEELHALVKKGMENELILTPIMRALKCVRILTRHFQNTP